MLGQMMQTPLLISSLLRHAAAVHGDTEIVSRGADGADHRYTYADAHHRACRLANALLSLGVRPGDRVATLAWNGHRHLELYYAVSGMGAVCHTVNPRLFLDQIAYIIDHAEDTLVCFDVAFRSLAEALAPRCPRVRAWVLLADEGDERDELEAPAPPGTLRYEALLAAQPDDFAWPALDEHTAAGLCYTSGTTGHPKGVLYSHRSTVLQAMAIALPDAVALSARDVLAPVSSMFHVMSWGLPYAASLVGSTLVLPGPKLDGASLFRLFEDEGVTVSAAVPTVWLGLATYMAEHALRLSTLKRVLIGGSACPRALIATLQDDFGVEVIHAWGMTETSPLGTVSRPKRKHASLPADRRLDLQVKQGRPVFGVEVKVVGADGAELPRDGAAAGDLLVRGPWVCASYFKADENDQLRDGWFPTGDVATIDPDSYVQITDRSKDVIKSGGEWISSIELENLAVAHPSIQEAAVIGVAHPKWGERPLVVAVRKPGATVSGAELLAFYEGKVAKWWRPDDVVFVAELPHTATGKLLKTRLRAEYRDYRLPTS